MTDPTFDPRRIIEFFDEVVAAPEPRLHSLATDLQRVELLITDETWSRLQALADAADVRKGDLAAGIVEAVMRGRLDLLPKSPFRPASALRSFTPAGIDRHKFFEDIDRYVDQDPTPREDRRDNMEHGSTPE